MTRDEIRTYVAENPMVWPPLSDWQRARLAVLLRPDLPLPVPVSASNEDAQPDG